VNVVPPRFQITQLRHRYIIALDDGAEKLGSIQVPHDRRLKLKLNADSIEFTRPPLDPAG